MLCSCTQIIKHCVGHLPTSSRHNHDKARFFYGYLILSVIKIATQVHILLVSFSSHYSCRIWPDLFHHCHLLLLFLFCFTHLNLSFYLLICTSSRHTLFLFCKKSRLGISHENNRKNVSLLQTNHWIAFLFALIGRVDM